MLRINHEEMKYFILFSFSLFYIFPNPSNTKNFKTLANETGKTTWINSLETVNTFTGRWCCANDGYLYGTDLKYMTTILRKRESGQGYETRGNITTVNPSFKVGYKMFGTSTPGLIFVLARTDSNNHYLLKSKDGAATFTKVFAFGQGNGIGGTDAANVRILRGVLELKRDIPSGGGTGTLYIGEYNVSQNRVAGSVNDRVRIMKSVDNGDTWIKVVEWNTNGVNQVGHIHAMRQDPYTGEIYVCTGDGLYKSGIIKWDGASPWADNKTLTEIGNMPGFKVVTGAQRYRVCDVLFDEKFIYTFADTQAPNNPSGTESGIWKGTKDLSSYIRVNNNIYNYDPMHIGWFGEKVGNTFIFTTSREYEDPANAWKELNTEVYVSSDGNNWYPSAILDWRDEGNPVLTRYINNVFSYNDKLYIDCVEGAGHSSVIQCEVRRKWYSDEDPVILHPVYFVGKWNAPGNDANSGTTPDAPKLTLGNILTNNRICAGARVRVAIGSFSEGDINPLWSAAGSQGRGSVVIEGKGMDSTHIIRSSGTGSAFGIKLEAAKTLTGPTTPLILKAVDFYVTVDGGVNHTNNVIWNVDSWVKTINCKIGNSANDDSPLISLAGTGTKYTSENCIHIANSNTGSYKSIVETNAPNEILNLKNCILLNAYDAFNVNYTGINLSLKNCTFNGIESRGVVFNINPGVQPVIENCIFSCGVASIDDQAGIAEVNVDYNLYSKPPVNITDGGHSLNSDPIFVDPGKLNFDLKSNSPGTLGGILLHDVLFDIKGRERWNPPCIGAYESASLAVLPDTLIIDSASGLTGEFRVISNTSWNTTHDSSWISCSRSSGTGNGTFFITTTSSNKTPKPRMAALTVSSAELTPLIVTVSQKGDISTKSPETKKTDIVIYPNPVCEILTINYNDDSFSYLNILNSSGMVIARENVVTPVQQLDFSKYEPGLYFLKFLNFNGKKMTIKVMKW
jgi:hypothetical protein